MPFGGDINVKVDISNFATKTDLKIYQTLMLVVSTEVDKLDINKLTSARIGLAKLSNVVKNDVVKKTEYDKLVNKVNGIDNTNFVSRTKCENDGSDFEEKIDKINKKIPDVSDLVKKSALTAVENKIPDVSDLVKKIVFNSKITEVESKIPSISGLTTNSALTAVENKIPNVTNLVTKTNFDAKLKAISDRVTKKTFFLTMS